MSKINPQSARESVFQTALAVLMFYVVFVGCVLCLSMLDQVGAALTGIVGATLQITVLWRVALSPTRPGVSRIRQGLQWGTLFSLLTAVYFPLVWLVVAELSSWSAFDLSSPTFQDFIFAAAMAGWITLIARCLRFGEGLRVFLILMLKGFRNMRHEYVTKSGVFGPGYWRSELTNSAVELHLAIGALNGKLKLLASVARPRPMMKLMMSVRFIAKVIEICAVLALIMFIANVNAKVFYSELGVSAILWGAVASGCGIALVYHVAGLVRDGIPTLIRAFRRLAVFRGPLATFGLGYMCMVFLFAGWFSVLSRVQPGSFCGHSLTSSAPSNAPDSQQDHASASATSATCLPQGSLTYGDFLFLSGTTFSTVGYGWNTVTPVSVWAQTAVALEPIVAFVWVTVVLAMLLTSMRARARPADRDRLIGQVRTLMKEQNISEAELLAAIR